MLSLVYSLSPIYFPLFLMPLWNFSTGLCFLKELLSWQVIFSYESKPILYEWCKGTQHLGILNVLKTFQALSRINISELACSTVCKSGWFPDQEYFFQNQMFFVITKCTMTLRKRLSQMQKCNLTPNTFVTTLSKYVRFCSISQCSPRTAWVFSASFKAVACLFACLFICF